MKNYHESPENRRAPIERRLAQTLYDLRDAVLRASSILLQQQGLFHIYEVCLEIAEHVGKNIDEARIRFGDIALTILQSQPQMDQVRSLIALLSEASRGLSVHEIIDRAESTMQRPPSPDIFVRQGMHSWARPNRADPSAEVCSAFQAYALTRGARGSSHRDRVCVLAQILTPSIRTLVVQFAQKRYIMDARPFWNVASNHLIRILWTYTPEQGSLEELLSREILKFLEQSADAALKREDQRRHPVDERDCVEMP